MSKAGIGRRQFLTDSARAALGLGCLNAGVKVLAQKIPPLAVHNMLIVGKTTTFLYHLPLFSFPGFVSPHRYQMILEATFTLSGKSLQDAYIAERGKYPDKQIYSFGPERFAFSSPDDFPKTLKGTIFRGHLEKKGSTPIFKDVVANITTVFWFRELDLSRYNPENPSKLQYIVFGRGQELFMAHLIYKPPDFDQILSVDDTGKQIINYLQEPVDEGETRTSIRLFRRPLVGFPQKNVVAQRLKQNQSIVGTFYKPVGNYIRFVEESASIKVRSEYYFEEGELRTPPEYATTPAERAAGFP